MLIVLNSYLNICINFKIEFNGFCSTTLINGKGLLLNGSTQIGVCEYKDKLYAFRSNAAAQSFIKQPEALVIVFIFNYGQYMVKLDLYINTSGSPLASSKQHASILTSYSCWTSSKWSNPIAMNSTALNERRFNCSPLRWTFKPICIQKLEPAMTRTTCGTYGITGARPFSMRIC